MTADRAQFPFGHRALISLAVAGLTAAAVASGAAAQGAAAPGAQIQMAPRIASQHTFTVPAGTSTFSAPGGSFRVVTSPSISPRTTITCTLTVGIPVYENNVEGVYGTASVSCSAPVEQLYIITAIYFDGSLAAETYGETSPGESSMSKTTSYNGGEGYYTTGADAEIWYPSGYSPSTGMVGPSYSLSVELQ